jgi:hypothetical protein
MRNYVESTIEELYERLIGLAHEASGFDLDEQDYYVNEIRCLLDEINERVTTAIIEKD